MLNLTVRYLRAIPVHASSMVGFLRRRSARRFLWLSLAGLVSEQILTACAAPVLPALYVKNDRDETVTIRRIDEAAAAQRQLRAGEGFVARGANNPFLKGTTGRGERGDLVYEVRGTDGTLYGRIAISPEFYRTVNVGLCLSAASEPPYRIDSHESWMALGQACNPTVQ